MNKQKILELTGMSEDQFYDMYPDQESFCSDYPEACAQLEQAQGGMQVGITYDRNGNPVNISPDVTPSNWQTVDGMYTRPHTVDRFGRPISSMTDVTSTPIDRVPFNREQPMDVISPLVARYTLPKGMVDNSKPIEKMTIPTERLSAAKTMYNVGSIGSPYTVPTNKYQSIVDMLKASGKDSSFLSRKELAKELGINNYTGTASQNMALMNALNSNNEMKYGGIHINPANKGKFTAWAQSHNMGVQEAASHVMANKEDYSPTIVKRANFAKNAAKFKHEDGGDVIIPEYKTGGHWIQGAVKHPGRCTPGSPNYDCPKGSPQWRLAQTFKKHHGFHEEGGTNIFPAMRNFKQGGYYGMDQKFHPNSDSGTYVGGAGYYFQPGGTATSASAPGTSGGVDISGVPGAGGLNADNSFAGDQFSDMSGLYGNDPFGVENQAYGEEDYAGNPYDESQQPMVYDPSQYSSEIDPNTGFTKYKKNGMALTKIKRQDPALWEHLKDEGHGARWRTGQTDIQRVGRAAGAIGQGLESAIDVAGAIGGYLSNRQKQQNLDKSAMNKGSTASMFTNPEGSGKGDYGITGSAYGMFKPNQMGNYSFKGMYGKYGMQVPKYAVGGFEPQIETLANYGLEGPQENISVPINYESLYALPSIPRDNTRVAPPIIPLDVRQKEIDYNNLKSSPLPNPNGKDVATKLNNPGNIIYSPTFSKLFGAIKSNIKQKDGNGYFAAFPSLDLGLKARETQLFGEVDGIFKSNYYNPDTSIDQALKTWSNKGYGVEIYPELKGKTLQEITPAQRRELMKRQIKRESGNMYKQLVSSGYFKNGGQQLGGQVVEMDENEIQQFLKAGGQLEFID